MKELISIIVPIYNVEKYLDRCINSIVNQSYKNLEIILVDDGSQDKCGEICDKWANNDERIKVIHKENGGLSDARNAGIEIAQGEYLSFIDSDDYIHKDFIKILYENCLKNDADISMCEVYITDKNEDTNREIKNENIKIIFSKDVLERKNNISCLGCDKLYKKSIFNNVRYPKGKINEDVAVIYKIMYYSNKISITDAKLYFYFNRPGSIMRKGFSKKRLDILDGLRNQYEFFIERNEEKYAYFILRDFLNSTLDLYEECLLLKEEKVEIKKILMKEYKKVYKKVVKNKNTNINMKIKYTIYNFFPIIYVFISKMKKKWRIKEEGI